MLMLMVREMMGLLLLRMVMGVMVIHGGIELRRAAGIAGDAIGNGGLHFTASIYGGRLVAVLRHVHHAGRRIRPVSVHHTVLATVVGSVTYIHPVERWESGIGHALRRLPSCRRTSVVWRGYALA